MAKLITAYAERRDAKSAANLVRYVNKHPMALCFASDEDNALVAEATKLIAEAA